MTVKKLEQIKKGYEDRLALAHEADADPNVIAIYISDLQYAIACLEDQIDFEKRIRIFRYTLYAFALIATAMVAVGIFKTI
jgi:hypothetical protein